MWDSVSKVRSPTYCSGNARTIRGLSLSVFCDVVQFREAWGKRLLDLLFYMVDRLLTPLCTAVESHHAALCFIEIGWLSYGKRFKNCLAWGWLCPQEDSYDLLIFCIIHGCAWYAVHQISTLDLLLFDNGTFLTLTQQLITFWKKTEFSAVERGFWKCCLEAFPFYWI